MEPASCAGLELPATDTPAAVRTAIEAGARRRNATVDDTTTPASAPVRLTFPWANSVARTIALRQTAVAASAIRRSRASNLPMVRTVLIAHA